METNKLLLEIDSAWVLLNPVIQQASDVARKARVELFHSLLESGMTELDAMRGINRALIIGKGGKLACPDARETIAQIAPDELAALENALGIIRAGLSCAS